MYFTWTESMKGFQEYSEFNKPEKEPKSLNRHWISHGRKTTIAAQNTTTSISKRLIACVV